MPRDDYHDCLKNLKEAQEGDKDNRDMVREADHFLNKRDGQWEPEIISQWSNRPRYTFDECNSIVDDIMGEMEAMEFDINVDPCGGDASKDLANAYEGIIRNIERISKAHQIYNAAARIMVGTGMSGWRIKTDWRDDSFFQDLFIKSIPSFEDSVWFDPDSIEQDGSDAEFCWVLTQMTRAKYDRKFKDGSGISVGDDRSSQAYPHKRNNPVTIGEYLYRKRMERELVLLTDGRVFEVNEDFDRVRDDILAQGIQVKHTRKRPYHVVYQRIFDGSDWLTDEKETVFQWVPIVPVYGNFRISENKIIYCGAIERIMDAQRVINYSASRNVEEVALGPKPKTWMTKHQAKSTDVRATLRTMNTNNDPVQFYDHVDGQQPPYQQPAYAPNQGLQATTDMMMNFVQRSSGTYDEARGTAPAQRSGVAIDALQTKSDNPKRKWFSAMEVALTHTCNILTKAIPKVYNSTQELQMINQDKTTDTITILEKVIDRETQQVIEINDLSKGAYNVTVDAGPAFQSRQQESVAAINEIAAIDPSIMAIGSDVLLNNIAAPGIDLIAERKRLQMVKQGLIPESQLTDDEKQMIAQQSQGQQDQPDPMMVAAQAEMIKAQTQAQTEAMKLELEQSKVALKQMELQLKAQGQQSKTMIDSIKTLNDQIKLQAETLKAIREAMGVDAVMDQVAASAFHEQAKDLHTSIVTS